MVVGLGNMDEKEKIKFVSISLYIKICDCNTKKFIRNPEQEEPANSHFGMTLKTCVSFTHVLSSESSAL
jgi:hypothetical protein